MEKPFLFAQAVVDDSAAQTGDERLFFAGYLTNANTWVLFADAWAEELAFPPAIEYLKMAEAQNRRDQFSGWEQTAIDEKLRGLARVIRHFNPFSFELSVSRREYAQMVSPGAPRGLATPYFPCVLAVVSSVTQYLHEEGVRDVKVDFVFDEQQGVSDDIALAFPWMLERLHSGAQKLVNSHPIFRDDKLYVPLQAADMLAWHIRREHETGAELPLLEEFLRKPGQHLMSELSPELLRQWAAMDAQHTVIHSLKSKGKWQRFRKEAVTLLASGFRPPHGTRWKNFVHGASERIARLFRL